MYHYHHGLLLQLHVSSTLFEVIRKNFFIKRFDVQQLNLISQFHDPT